MPNTFAYIALIFWPIITIFLFKHLRPISASFWTIVGGFLILPVKVSIDFPMIPEINKLSLASLCALAGCIMTRGVKVRLLPEEGAEKWLIVLLLIIPFFTVLNNREVVYIGSEMIPGLKLYDSVSIMFRVYISLVPFLIGLQLFKTKNDQLELFKLLVIAGIWYSLPILFEIRMSPQLHTWVYGFFPHSFIQQIRFGGFRPVVFLGHGLIVSMFVVTVLASSVILWKEKLKTYSFSALSVMSYFIVLLFLCKSVGPFLLGVGFLIIAVYFKYTWVKAVCLIFLFIVYLYPILGIFDLFPHELFIDVAKVFSIDRAQSLSFRFFHEGQLLDRANEKFWFGWGDWGRNRLEKSVTDGFWVIIFGQSGAFGFASLFGLLTLSVARAIRSFKLITDKRELGLLLNHALLIAIIMIDQLPNSSLSRGWMWFLVGALLGRANHIIRQSKQNQVLTERVPL